MKLLKIISDAKDKSLDFGAREASRSIVFDKNYKIPILHVTKFNYHKLPGGGIEKGEDKIKALNREMLEKTGCKIEVKGEVGKIIEFRSKFKLKQTSYCYFGKVVNVGSSKLEQDEINDGFELVWLRVNEAIQLFEKDLPTNYEGKFIQNRDLTFLQKLKYVLQDADKETKEILADKKLM